jgi:hypothetical protein
MISSYSGTEFDLATGRALKEFKSLAGVTAVRRQSNGHTIVAGVNLAGAASVAVLELDAADREVHRAIFPGFQLLPNGHVVLANWQGHGEGHGAQGVQLLEFDAGGRIVWQWSRAEWISSLQGVVVLDGLDPRVLHDEHNGVMSP